MGPPRPTHAHARSAKPTPASLWRSAKGLQLGNVLKEQIHHVNEAAQEEEVLEGLHLSRLKQGQKPSPRGERRSPEDVAAATHTN